ncbi:MAG: tetratricopeptide repeat protein [Myxococcales bacterium]|nr:tetratricopeptide repeat protein [Myxococcales bacterium]
MQKLGNYSLIEVLGDGPHGPVYLALEPVQGRSVVVKPIPGAHRLLDAVDPLLAISSPYVARMLGASEPSTAAALTAHDAPFIVRDLVNGAPLDALRRAVPTFSLPFALGVLDGVARGLSAFHSAGIAHGNLKLGNVLVGRSGELRLTDPALLARVATAPLSPDEWLSGRFGAVPLVSPERLDGDPTPTLEDDLWAFGALATWLLADAWPYDEPDPRRAAEERRRRPARGLPAQVPAELQAVLAALLSRDRTSRPASIGDVGKTIDSACKALGVDPDDALEEGIGGMSLAFMQRRSPTAAATPSPARAAPVSPAPGPARAELPPLELDQPSRPTAERPSSERPTAERPTAERPSTERPTAERPLPGIPNLPSAPPASTPSRGQASTAGPRPMRALPTGEAPMLQVRSEVDAVPTASGGGVSTAWIVLVVLLAAAGYAWWDGRKETVAPPPAHAAGETPTRSDALDAARTAAKGTSHDEALRTALEAARLMPTSGEAQKLLSDAYWAKGRKEDAAAAALLAADRAKDDASVQRWAAERLLAAGRTTDALAVTTKAVESHGTDAVLHYFRGVALKREGRLDEASDALSLAAELDGEAVATWLELGEVKLALSRFPAARDAFERAATLSPKSGKAYAGLARALVGLGRGDEAVALLERGIELATDPSEVRFAIGWVKLKGGDHAGALPFLTTFATEHPDDARGSFALGAAQLLAGEASAAASLRRSVELDPSVPEAWFDLGVAELAAGKTDDSLAAFAKATQTRFGMWQAHCERGRLLYRLGRHDDASPGLTTTLELAPGAAVAEGLLNAPRGSTLGELIAAVPCGPSVLLP